MKKKIDNIYNIFFCRSKNYIYLQDIIADIVLPKYSKANDDGYMDKKEIGFLLSHMDGYVLDGYNEMVKSGMWNVI